MAMMIILVLKENKTVGRLCLQEMVKMKIKFGVFLLPLIFFNFFQQQINGEINGEIKDNGCQNWTETLQDQNLTEVTKPNLYRIHQNINQDYDIYLGNEPFTIWMDLKDQVVFSINGQIYGYPQGNNPNVFLQIHGRSDCQIKIETTENGLNTYIFWFNDNRDCLTSCPEYQGKYTPFRMWSEGGPVKIYVNSIELHFLQRSEKLGFPPIIYFLPENQMSEFSAARACEQSKWLNTFLPNSDYTHLKSEPNEVFKNESGINFIRLKSYGNTVVWVEIKDSAPEHFVIIQLENGSQPLDENVVVGLEANGVEPVSYDLEKNFTEIPNGIKIYLKKVICVGNYNFLGYIRYIFNINITNNYNFTATFYDASGMNLELKYLEEEKEGNPKPYDKPYQFEFFTISPPSATTTSSLTSTTSPNENIPNEIDETPSAAPMVQPQNEIPSKAAEISEFSFPILIALFMAQKLFVLFL